MHNPQIYLGDEVTMLFSLQRSYPLIIMFLQVMENSSGVQYILFILPPNKFGGYA